MTLEAKKIIRAWEIRHDRIPQLRKIASNNDLDPVPLLTYEALSYATAQWGSAMTWPNTELTEEVVKINEISRPYLARHAQLFLDAPELPSRVKKSIKPILDVTAVAWTNPNRVTSARKQLDTMLEANEGLYRSDPLYLESLNYTDSQENIIIPLWNEFLRVKYDLNS